MLSRCRRDIGCKGQPDFNGNYLVAVDLKDWQPYYKDTAYLDTVSVTCVDGLNGYEIKKFPTYQFGNLQKENKIFNGREYKPGDYVNGNYMPKKTGNNCIKWMKYENTGVGAVLWLRNDSIIYSQSTTTGRNTFFKTSFTGRKIN